MSSRAAKATSRATRSRAAESGAGTRKDASSRLPGPSKQKPAKPSGKVRASLSVDGVPVTEFPVPRIERQLESLNSASEDLQKQLGVHDARLSAVEDDVRELREEIAQFVAALLKPVNPEKQVLESKDSKLYGTPRQLEGGSPVKANLAVLAAQISQAAATQAVMPANSEATGVPGDPDGDPSPPSSDKEDKERGSHERKSRRRRSRKKKTSSRSSDSSSSSDSSTSSSDSDAESTDSEAERRKRKSRRKRAILNGILRKGPRFPGLKPLRATNPLYDQLLDYRYYRLRKTSQSRSSRDTGKAKEYVKRMEYTLKEHSFNGTDPIRVLAFLAKFVEEADILRMSEG